jgi:HD-like signal output (HDOD) protein
MFCALQGKIYRIRGSTKNGLKKTMEATCPECQKVFEIPAQRLKKYDKPIQFDCPACKKGRITIDLGIPSTPVKIKRQASSKKSTARSRPAQPATGTALKRKILRKMEDLPPMPQIVIKAREFMGDPNAGINDLVKLFEKDQSIVAKVLRLGNSAYYGVSGKIATVKHAAVLLGLKTLSEVITMAGISNLMGRELKGYGFDSGDLWRHSLAVGFGAKFLADRIKPSLSNDAFVAGLIHDAGKIVLDEYVLERKDEIATFMAVGDHTYLDAEKNLLGLDHAEIAGNICKKWIIPDSITQGIRWHHRPSSRPGGNEMSLILHVADYFAKMSGMGTSINDLSYQMEADAFESLGFEEEELDYLLVDVMESVETIAAEFQDI